MNKTGLLTTAAIFLLSTSVGIHATSCQEQREDWHPMYFRDIFRRPVIEGLIKARVARLFPPVHVPELDQDVVTAELAVECVYRGGGVMRTMPLVNVTGFGQGNDCVDTMVVVGSTYLIFVKPFGHLPRVSYVVQEYNLQRAAFTASAFKVAAASSVYECHRPTGAVSTTLSPWKSLTPIKQLPWIILPDDVKVAEPPPPGSGGERISLSSYTGLLVMFAVTLKLSSP